MAECYIILTASVVLVLERLLCGGDGSFLSVGARLYRKLKVYLMTEDQLQEHGYPRSNPEAPGRAILYNLPEKKPVSDRESPRSLKRSTTAVVVV